MSLSKEEKIELRDEILKEYAEAVFVKVDDNLAEVLDAFIDEGFGIYGTWLERESNLIYGKYTIQEFLSKLDLNTDCYLDSSHAEKFLSLSVIKELYNELEEGDILEEYRDGSLTSQEIYSILEEISNDSELEERPEYVMDLLEAIIADEQGFSFYWIQAKNSDKFYVIIDADIFKE